MDDSTVHPYWNFSWRLIGRALAFLLIPWGVSLVNGNFDQGKSAFRLGWWLFSGKWAPSYPGLASAFWRSLASVGIAALLSLILAILIWLAFLQLGRRPWTSFALRWTILPFFLAPIVALAVIWANGAGTFTLPVVASALLISLYPAGVSALATSRSGEAWDLVASVFHSMPNAIGGLLVTESILGIDGIGRRFVTDMKASRWSDGFWIVFLVGAVALALHILGDLAWIGADKSPLRKDEGWPDSPYGHWTSIAVGAAALVAAAIVRTNWAQAAMRTSGAFLILAPLLFVPALAWGVLIGELRHKGGKARETVAGILGWPLYIFFAVPGFYWVLVALAGKGHRFDVLSAVAALYLLPRLAAVSSEAWGKRPHRSGSRMYGWQHAAIMLVALMAWTAGMGVFAISVPGFLGFGLPNTEPELGKMLAGALHGGDWLPLALALVYVPFLWNAIADSVLHLTKVHERKQWIW